MSIQQLIKQCVSHVPSPIVLWLIPRSRPELLRDSLGLMCALGPPDWSGYWITHKGCRYWILPSTIGLPARVGAGGSGVGWWGWRGVGGAIRSAYHRGSSRQADSVSHSPRGGAASCCKLSNFLPHRVNSVPYRVTGGHCMERHKYLTIVIGSKEGRDRLRRKREEENVQRRGEEGSRMAIKVHLLSQR